MKLLKASFNTMMLISFLAICCWSCSDDITNSNEMEQLSGYWELTTTVISSTNGIRDGETKIENIFLVQSDDEISIITSNGLWGNGTIADEMLTFAGTEMVIDSTGCESTQVSTGTITGDSSYLEGTLATEVTFDPATCPGQEDFTLEIDAEVVLLFPYACSCIDRDEFGDPSQSEYVLPYPAGKTYYLNNSYCTPTGGHSQQMAYDFIIPIGEEIIASRAGIVRTVKEDSPDNGLGTDHNHVLIEHEDGTVAFYAHLMQWGVEVVVGDTITQGQFIAYAGHSGTPDVVHLHFGVYSCFPPQEGDDEAINFCNTDDPVDCRGGLVMGEYYTADW